MLKTDKFKSTLNKLIIIAVWLGIWQIASIVTGLEILLASPVNVFMALIKLLGTSDFYRVIFSSFMKITGGFLAAFLIGCITGALAGRFKQVQMFLSVPVQLMKTMPVASFIILLLIWFGSNYIAMWISFIVVYPMVHISVIAGISNQDKNIMEMAEVFDISFGKRIRCIYLPRIIPFVEANLKTSLGMSWKAGVSAEIIGLTVNSIGEQFYYSKLYLMTAELFAWSIVVVVVSLAFEKIFLWIIKCVDKNIFKLS